mmetsp:Transcript_34297/g.57592  ORF Transcript_34297/g.57592 Transcript_34297/m.57592 type:complete len:222 (-) Transcript_34297:16-681(-)
MGTFLLFNTANASLPAEGVLEELHPEERQRIERQHGQRGERVEGGALPDGGHYQRARHHRRHLGAEVPGEAAGVHDEQEQPQAERVVHGHRAVDLAVRQRDVALALLQRKLERRDHLGGVARERGGHEGDHEWVQVSGGGEVADGTHGGIRKRCDQSGAAQEQAGRLLHYLRFRERVLPLLLFVLHVLVLDQLRQFAGRDRHRAPAVPTCPPPRKLPRIQQ